MSVGASRIYEFTAARDGVLRLSLPPDGTTAAVLKPPASPREGGRALVPTRSFVRAGDRVDTQMRLPSGQLVTASGVVTKIGAARGSSLPMAEIAFARSHTLRVRAMLEAVGTARQLAPTVVEDIVRVRVRGTESLLDAIHPPSERDGGCIAVPWRREFSFDQRVLLEIGLGPFVDEILVVGRIVGRTAGDGHRRARTPRSSTRPLSSSLGHALLEIERLHGTRLRYVVDVLEGRRDPNARDSRRLPLKLAGRWWTGARVEQQTFDDVSRSGVFVSTADPPSIGSRVNVELLNPRFNRGRLRFGGEVRWISDDPRRQGFGAQFLGAPRASLEELRRFLDREAADLPDWV